MRYLCSLLLVVFVVACGPTKEMRREYVQTHDRPQHIEQTILEGKITTGMTKEDVKASWGQPDHVNESYYQGVGAQTQWCYGQYSSQCVYFEQGEVTGWN